MRCSWRRPSGAFLGPGAAFEGDKGLRVPDDFPDGIGKTILVVEARTAVPWTKPEDIPFGHDLPLPEFGLPRRGQFGRFETGEYTPDTFYAALVDGSYHAFEVGISPSSLRGWITRNGGEKILDD